MARRHTHFQGNVRESRSFETGVKYSGLCGDEAIFDGMTENPENITCPKCSAKWSQKFLDGLDQKVELKKASLGGYRDLGGYRSAWEVFVDGESRGFVTMDGSARSGWNTRAISRAALTKDRNDRSKIILDHGDSYYILRFKSKEAAAVAMMQNIDLFQTREQYAEEQAAFKAKLASANERLMRAAAEKIEENTFAKETIEAMIAERDLSNAERAALETALTAINRIIKSNGG